ncbi:uroporphyrinogen-III C-methyltransferase [Thalassomonas viridans]|uniref:Uroporphyrinogen-III C-methyltransferase n=1 Tax=Thalassomonas viridans TaxID=137584 RepID=A0AAF0C974_9GAMM|nr:uroporphyrinogen-III C-methyltransferase [Thalassomonas viridans]WDE05488.1 uroporphyrinogen-III C-methyltransferase [Thalassomonas viridans]
MTEQKQPEDTVQKSTSTPEKPAVSAKAEKTPPGSASGQKVPAKMKKSPETLKIPVSKTGVLALVLALLACTSSAGWYYWHNQQQAQQQQQTQQTLTQQLETRLNAAEQQLNDLLQAREKQLTERFNRQIKQLQSRNEQQVSQLNQNIKGLQQEQPGNWLFNEVEYLIRMASRTLWLEQDKDTAISLLTDAEQRLSQTKNPELLPVRRLIFQDIETLKLLPQQQSAEVVLSLMGLGKQLDSLVLARPYRAENQAQEENLSLTSDPADWRENLSKVWQKFRANYIITSRPRTQGDDPLLSPEHQQNLRQNLALKLQLAIWAASQGESALYRQALDDIRLWLTQYYETDNKTNQAFIAAVEELKPATLTVNYPEKLVSLAAIRKVIEQAGSNKAAPRQAHGQLTPAGAQQGGDSL